MPELKHVLIVAGDASGDQHGAELAKALRAQHPTVKVSALGGAHLRDAADQFLFPLVAVGGFGFWEPLLKISKLWQARSKIQSLLQEDRPDVLVPIDYYGFNIHTARLGRSLGIPVIYYVSPQVWASRPGRVQKLGRVITKMLVIFPFEEELYRKAGIDARFVGHPLMDRVPAPAALPTQLRIGLLPGSRWGSIQRHLPIMAATAESLRQRYPHAEFLIFRPKEISATRYQALLQGFEWLKLVEDPDYRERRGLSLALSVSGTSALENMLLGIPMVIMYQLSRLTYEIARRLIRVPFIAIPNILAGRLLVPELIQSDARPEKLSQAAADILDNPTLRDGIRQDLLALRGRLGTGGAARRAAEEISMIVQSSSHSAIGARSAPAL